MTGRTIPESLSSMARHFARARRRLQFGWDAVSVWWPSPEELAGLDFLAELRAREWIRRSFLADRKLYELGRFLSPANPPSRTPPPETLPTALQKMLLPKDRTWSEGERARKLSEARAAYNLLVEQDLVQPLIDEGLVSTDPIRKNLLVQLAHVSRRLHRLMPELEISPEQFATGRRRRQDGEGMPASQLEELRQLSDLAMRLTKELNRRGGNSWLG